MPPLNPKLNKRALKEGVIVGPGNTVPLQVGFSECTLPKEWNSSYIPLSQKYPQLQTTLQPQQLTRVKHSDGSTALCFTNPALSRSLSQNFAFRNRSPFGMVDIGKNPLSIPKQYMQPKIAPRHSISARPNHCQFCISTPSTSSSTSKFQIEKPLSPEHKG